MKESLRGSFRGSSSSYFSKKTLSEEVLDPDKGELHRLVIWQVGVVTAMLKYMDAVPDFFKSLLDAHEGLHESGIAVVRNKTPLVQRLKDALTCVENTIKEVRLPLRDIRARLDECIAELLRADRAKDAVESLRKEIGQQIPEHQINPPARTSRLFSSRQSDPANHRARSEDDLQRLTELAAQTDGTAQELVEACRSDFDEMVESSGRVISTVIEAFGVVIDRNFSTVETGLVSHSISCDMQLLFDVSTTTTAIKESHPEDFKVSMNEYEKCDRFRPPASAPFIHGFDLEHEVPDEYSREYSCSVRNSLRHLAVCPSGVTSSRSGTNAVKLSPRRHSNTLRQNSIDFAMDNLNRKFKHSVDISGDDLFELNDAVFNIPVGTCISTEASHRLFELLRRIHTAYSDSDYDQSDARFICDYVALLGTMQQQPYLDQVKQEILLSWLHEVTKSSLIVTAPLFIEE